MASGFRVPANTLLPSEPKEAHNRGSMEPKHKRLMDMWSKETNERASPPSPTSSSAGSAPKSVQLGKSKPGGVAVFAHCIKFQHGLCASPTCPDGKQHVFVKCKRTYPAGGKCNLGDACWFHHP